MEIKIKQTGPIFDKKRREGIIQTELLAAMHEALLYLEREVKERTPIGATGILRGSIFSELRGQPINLHGVVASPQEYAAPVEHGTAPHWPPQGPIRLWVKRKLNVSDKDVNGVAFLIARKISQKGTKGAHMFENALKDGHNTVTNIFQRAGFDISAKLD